MWKYVLKRSLSILLVSLIALIGFFFMRQFLPNAGLPCSFEDIINAEEEELVACKNNLEYWGLNQPIFYISLSTKAFPKEYFYTLPSSQKRAIKKAILKGKDGQCLMQTTDWSQCPHIAPWKQYMPVLYWHGSKNQFHTWLSHLITLDFGYSYEDKLPVSQKVFSALQITILISAIALTFILMTGVSLAIIPYLLHGFKEQSRYPYVLILLANIPSFVLAILVQLCFTSNYISPYLNWFPATGLGGDGFLDKMHHLMLPIFSLSFIEICYLTLQVYASIGAKQKSPFVLYARSKRLKKAQIFKRFILPTALLPLIPLIQNFFISLITGALLIEVIFNISGMGRLTYQALLSNDLNTIHFVVFLAAFFSGIGFLIADLTLYFLDPRIRLEQ